MAATIPSPNIGLYGGMFSRNTSGWYNNKNQEITNQEVANELATSGFTSIMLWTVGVVYPGGDVYFNGTPDSQPLSPRLASNGSWDPDGYYSSYLPDCLSTLKGSGQVKQVLFSIGCGAGTDWANISKLLGSDPQSSVIVQNLLAIHDNLDIDGYDFDDEEVPLEATGGAITTLTGILAKAGMTVTWCPYTNLSTWASLLSDVYTANNNTQLVSWWNLQCYAGGTGNQPMEWANAITSTAGQPTGLDAAQAQAFVIPGYDPPTAFGIALSSLSGANPFSQGSTDSPLPGAFLWQAPSIFGAGLKATAFPTVIMEATGG
jgi:hypothetical protein